MKGAAATTGTIQASEAVPGSSARLAEARAAAVTTGRGGNAGTAGSSGGPGPNGGGGAGGSVVGSFFVANVGSTGTVGVHANGGGGGGGGQGCFICNDANGNGGTGGTVVNPRGASVLVPERAALDTGRDGRVFARRISQWEVVDCSPPCARSSGRPTSCEQFSLPLQNSQMALQEEVAAAYEWTFVHRLIVP